MFLGMQRMAPAQAVEAAAKSPATPLVKVARAALVVFTAEAVGVLAAFVALVRKRRAQAKMA